MVRKRNITTPSGIILLDEYSLGNIIDTGVAYIISDEDSLESSNNIANEAIFTRSHIHPTEKLCEPQISDSNEDSLSFQEPLPTKKNLGSYPKKKGIYKYIFNEITPPNRKFESLKAYETHNLREPFSIENDVKNMNRNKFDHRSGNDSFSHIQIGHPVSCGKQDDLVKITQGLSTNGNPISLKEIDSATTLVCKPEFIDVNSETITSVFGELEEVALIRLNSQSVNNKFTARPFHTNDQLPRSPSVRLLILKEFSQEHNKELETQQFNKDKEILCQRPSIAELRARFEPTQAISNEYTVIPKIRTKMLVPEDEISVSHHQNEEASQMRIDNAALKNAGLNLRSVMLNRDNNGVRQPISNGQIEDWPKRDEHSAEKNMNNSINYDLRNQKFIPRSPNRNTNLDQKPGLQDLKFRNHVSRDDSRFNRLAEDDSMDKQANGQPERGRLNRDNFSFKGNRGYSVDRILKQREARLFNDDMDSRIRSCPRCNYVFNIDDGTAAMNTEQKKEIKNAKYGVYEPQTNGVTINQNDPYRQTTDFINQWHDQLTMFVNGNQRGSTKERDESRNMYQINGARLIGHPNMPQYAKFNQQDINFTPRPLITPHIGYSPVNLMNANHTQDPLMCYHMHTFPSRFHVGNFNPPQQFFGPFTSKGMFDPIGTKGNIKPNQNLGVNGQNFSGNLV